LPHILLLISHPDIEKTRIWGKTFEYLWTRRPILALASEGATTNIIRRENSGYIVHPNDCKGIKKSIMEFISRKESNDINLTSGNGLNKYSRIELTKKLTSIIGEFTKME
jgi:hypothetical protein